MSDNQAAAGNDSPSPLVAGRVFALDAARGVALVFVCLAHFLDMYFLAPGAHKGAALANLHAFTKIATPTFMLVSSMVLGYLIALHRRDAEKFRLRVFDRALFLVTAGHVVSAVSLIPRHGLRDAFLNGHVTDTIAVCMIGGILMARRTDAATRVGLGLLLYAAGWIGWLMWEPDHAALKTGKGMLLGADELEGTGFSFPLLPWFAVYLVGTALGEWINTVGREQLADAGKRLAFRSGIVLVCAVVVKAGILLVLPMFRSPGLIETISTVQPWFSPYQKHPPGPCYVIFFGSAALSMIGLFLWRAGDVPRRRGLPLLACMGKHALSLYLLQSFVYLTGWYLLVTRTQFATPAVAVVFLLLSLAGIAAWGIFCDRVKINRFWTVGLQTMVRRWPALNEAIAAPRPLQRALRPQVSRRP